MSFRLQCKTGRLSLDTLSTSSSVYELQLAISAKTSIQPNKQKILVGYPPAEISSYNKIKTLADVGIRKGDMIILQELDNPRNGAAPEMEALSGIEEPPPPDNDHYTPASSNGYTLSRRVVPADNSCLFKSISILLCQNMSCTELRELVAGVITSQPDVYTQAVLGKPIEEYVEWIMKQDSWGGAIEVAIFSRLFSTELDVVDIQTKRIEKFGEGIGSSRSLLLYDGIHYDPLVMCDHHGSVVQSLFPISDEHILESALQIATEANQCITPSVMSEHLVEYCVVVGHETTSDTKLTGVKAVSLDVDACIIQRFPAKDRPGVALPNGIQRFCRPLGWSLTKYPSAPAYTAFILTSETGQRLFCCSLNFNQPSGKMAYKQRQQQKEKERQRTVEHKMKEGGESNSDLANGGGRLSPFSERRRTAFKRREEPASLTSSTSPVPPPQPTSSSNDQLNTSSLSISSIDINLDEGNEARYQMDKLNIEEFYEPISLCLISKFQIFDGLQALLKSLYIYWYESDSWKNVSSTKRRQQTIEPLIAELLTDIRFPMGAKPPVKRSFGPLQELVLPNLASILSIPYTSTDVYSLMKCLGINGIVKLFTLLLADGKVLFISHSSTALTSAIIGLMSLMYPVPTEHYSCVIIPSGLLDCLQCITPFIMGLHKSLLEELDEEPLDVAIVDLDTGHIQAPEMLSYSTLPSELMAAITNALGRIIHPGYDSRDQVFGASIDSPTLTSYEQDKAIRAVFISVFLYLIGNYQQYLTVLRFHPEPRFFFDVKEYKAKFTEGELDEAWSSFLKSFCETIGFISFTKGKRAHPYRICDLFDELVNVYFSEPDVVTIERLFSSQVISSITKQLIELQPPLVVNGGEYSQRSLRSVAALSKETASHSRFPELKEEEIQSVADDIEARWKGAANITSEDIKSNAPLQSQSVTSSLTRSSSVQLRDVDALHKFLDALFNSRVLEARKYFPAVTLSLRANTTIGIFVPELVNRLLKRGSFLTSEQFEILVRVLNIVLTNEKVAIQVLPLTAVFYQEVHPGVNQYIYTCLQSHQLWSNHSFWANALFHAVQSELVRVYAEIMSPRRGSGVVSDEVIEEELEEDLYEDLEKDNDMNIGEITLRQRQRMVTSTKEVYSTARRVALSKGARMRIRASMVIPGASEGVLPPDAKPVTTQEALHHLAKRLRVWSSLGENEKQQFILQEENAIKNQIILFINRIINMKTPIEFADRNEKSQFVNNLTLFIDRLLSIVDEDLSIGYNKQKDIMEQVEAMIEVHLNSLDYLRRLLKKSPTAKVRVAKPPLIQGEEMIMDSIHCYLLPDGRDIGSLVPADGYVFVTSYRIIFLGSPWDPEVDPNILVTRSMPIASIYRIKELSQIPASLTMDCVVTRGIQIRSTTSELIRLGFDDEGSVSKLKALHNKLNQLRYPEDIVLGLKNQQAFQVNRKFSCHEAPPPETKERSRSILPKQKRNDDPTTEILLSGKGPSHFKLVSDLSRSPYCVDYDRLGLGSVNIPSKNKGNPWRLTTINLPYTLCNSYPSVWVVPDKLTDDTLARIASQFQSNRIPVVTWRHPVNESVLLRSSSFVTPSVTHRKKPSIHLSKNTSTERVIDMGILSPDIEALVTTIVNACPLIESHNSLHSSFTGEMSMPPTSLVFDAVFDQASNRDSVDGDSSPASGQQYHYSLYSAADAGYDWESNVPSGGREYSRTFSEDQPMTMGSAINQGDWENQPMSMVPLTSLEGSSISEEPLASSPYNSPKMTRRLSMTSKPLSRRMARDVGEVFGRGISKKSKQDSTQVNFASLPTAPRDWVVMDALQDELENWQTDGLYIIGEKKILGGVPSDVYAGCTLLPVEIPHFQEISNSFCKLMRACAPSGSSSNKYLSQVEESEWLNQISSTIQLATAISHLLDSQGSSVMICLEEGMDVTTQVVSLAQLLIDPYYRTIAGFIVLIEKEWLAFGHPFSCRSNQVDGTDTLQFSPVFLQFLDCVHQIHRQFPLSFEFNDFFLRTIAYHHCSMRFHTFTLNNEKERCTRNWLQYRPRPAATYGSDSSNTEPHSSLWQYIDLLRTRSTMFQNFLYSGISSSGPSLCPRGYQANLDVWSYFLDNSLSFFPPYDVELISDAPLTYSDLHYDVFQWDSTLADVGNPIDPPPDVANELTLLLKQYTGLKNDLAQHTESPITTWEALWSNIVREAFSKQHGSMYSNSIQPQQQLRTLTSSTSMSFEDSYNADTALMSVVKRHNATLHKTTSLAVLIKGKLSIQMEKQCNNPHEFIPFQVSSLQFECSFCHHFLKEKQGYKCSNCGCVCHHHCRHSMPHNCGKPKIEQKHSGSKEKDDVPNPIRAWSVSKPGSSDLHECEGFLYKKGGMVKNWKLRYFVLDIDKKHLAYYESDKKDAKLCGKIMMDDIVSIEECEHQHVPTTILPSGRLGYFFKLTTHHRVFHLMTYRSSTRSIWLQRVSTTCCSK